jgi:2-dehydropantoate 2-reductase
MNIIVFGAGAIGSLYAAKLSTAHDVTVVARPAHADAINQSGLRLTGLERTTCRVPAVTAISSIPRDTLVLLTTKVNDNRAAARAMASVVHPDTILLCIQNGLGGEEIVKQAIVHAPDSRSGAPHASPLVLRAVTQFGAIFVEPGVIDYRVAGYTLIERTPAAAGAPEAGSTISERIAALFSACGLDGRVSENIKIEVWRKLIFNCVINPLTSIMGAEVGAIADTRLDPIKRLVIDECLAVARADGATFTGDAGTFVETIAAVFGPSRNLASMQQDLLKAKATEIDFMNGAVVTLGRRFGIDCPVNAALVAIIKAMEARGRFVVP